MNFSEMTKHKTIRLSFEAEILLMLIPCVGIASFYYGLNAVKLIAAGVIGALLTDTVLSRLIRKKITLNDCCALITGIACALALPASAPVWLALLCSFTAIAVGRIPFGDFTRLPFSPPAVGIVFAQVIYPDLFFDYIPSQIGTALTNASLTSMLSEGKSVNMTLPSVFTIISGNVMGPIGTGCVLLMIACLVYLMFRHLDEFIVSAGFISVCTLFSVLFPRVLSGRQTSLLMEMSGGMLLFSAVFLLNIPRLKFKTFFTGLLYGMGGGILCMLIRYFGNFEEGAAVAVLIMNVLSPFFTKKDAYDTSDTPFAVVDNDEAGGVL